jgi:hypothetical protein
MAPAWREGFSVRPFRPQQLLVLFACVACALLPACADVPASDLFAYKTPEERADVQFLAEVADDADVISDDAADATDAADAVPNDVDAVLADADAATDSVDAAPDGPDGVTDLVDTGPDAPDGLPTDGVDTSEDVPDAEQEVADAAPDALAGDADSVDAVPDDADGDADSVDAAADSDVSLPDPCTSLTCDDGNACTDDTCVPASGCVFIANSATCTDNDACTLGDACSDATCTPGGAANCSDGNPCTDDGCAWQSGCVNLANAVTCDDGFTCTSGDVCSEGQCSGAATGCNDGDPCTTDTCHDSGEACSHVSDPKLCDDANPCTDDSCATGVGCVNLANANTCTDGTVCTDGDGCSGGACVPGAALNCVDDVTCTVDSCDSALGCVHGVDAGKCDDANPCTEDYCDAIVGCLHSANSAACDDGDLCTVSDACSGGLCVGGGSKCDDGNACTFDTCALGACSHYDNSDPCDDGDACTLNDGCVTGSCIGGGVNPCDDGNVCTADSCSGSCQHSPLSTGGCDDGNACTSGDTCLSGGCVGTAKDCSDNNACTLDLCDTVTATCSHPPQAGACDDGNDCTVSDTCNNGQCLGTTPGCDDSNPCTSDTCDAQGGCKHTALTGTSCDKDVCNVNGTCDTGVCAFTVAKDCSDGDACTGDSCNLATGCKHLGLNSGNCATDACLSGMTCSAGKCQGGSAISCNDSEACTEDSCNSASGCVHAPVSGTCDDGNACTSGDVCSAGKCLSGGATNCNDNNPCTDDACSPLGGCSHTGNNANPCSDGFSCTTESCVSGKCVVTADSAVCGDSNVCTDDSCAPGSNGSNPTTGCRNANNAAPCTDGSLCTTNDTCIGGACVSGPPLNCDDGLTCTADACDATQGCKHTPGTETCNGLDDNCDGQTDEANSQGCTIYFFDSDNDAYGTASSQCLCAISGKYRALVQGDCDDNNAAIKPNATEKCNGIDDNCDGKTDPSNATGCTVYYWDGDGDGYGVTLSACLCASSGAYTANKQGDCNDYDATIHATAPELCDNKDNDCNGVTDDGGASALCEDGNACTTNTCDTGECSTTVLANGSPCDDGNVCTVGDGCTNGACTNTLMAWKTSVGGSSIDTLENGVATSDGGFIAVGYTQSVEYNANGSDAFFAKFDTQGTVTWTKAMGTAGSDFGSGIAQTADGGYVFVGKTLGASAYDGVVTRVTSSGSASWTKLYGDGASNDDALSSVLVLANGDLVVLGTTSSKGAGGSDLWLMRLNALGTVIWEATFGGTGGEVAGTHNALVATGDGGFVIVGSSPVSSFGGQGYVVRVDGSGKKVWERTFGGAGNDAIDSLVVTSDGGLALVGSYNNNDLWVIRTDGSGAQIWSQTYDHAGGADFGRGIYQRAADGSFIVLGQGAESVSGGGDAWLLRIDGNGGSIGQATYGTAGKDDLVGGLIVPASGGAAFPGSVDGTTSRDAWFQRVDAYGNGTCAASGICATYAANACDDSKACTTDFCDAAHAGCYHVTLVNTQACDDGNACTTGDVCTSGTCAGSAAVCGTDAGCVAGTGCTCNPGFWGTGTGSCSCGGFITPVTTASGTQNICAYDYPVWGVRPASPNTLVSANGATTVVDSGTQLMWGAAALNTSSKGDATTQCDALTLAGYSDWRVPTFAELLSLLDYNASNPAISPLFGANVYGLWSTTPYVPTAGYFWSLSVGTGSFANSLPNSTLNLVHCVRTYGAFAPPVLRFSLIDSNSDSQFDWIQDNATGLKWQYAPSSNTYGYNGATTNCNNLTLAGTTGWSMPSAIQLASIIDRTKSFPALPSQFINVPPANLYWSKTPYAIAPANVWDLDPSTGIFNVVATSNTLHVICVK